MKITAKQYALAFFETIHGQEEQAIKQATNNLIKLLAANQALKKLPEVLRYFSNIWQAETTMLEATVTSARPLEQATQTNIKQYLQAHSDKTEINLISKIDPQILGGVIISYRDQILDASLKTNLHHLKNKLSA